MSRRNLCVGYPDLASVNNSFRQLNAISQNIDGKGIIGTAAVRGIYFLSPTLSPALIAANTTAEQTFTVPGLPVKSVVVVNKPTAQAGLGIVGARVSANNTLGITFSNNTGGNITPTASEIYLVAAFLSQA